MEKMTQLEVWKAKDGWRWRLVHKNGKTIAESGEAYSRKGEATRMWKRTATYLVEHITAC